LPGCGEDHVTAVNLSRPVSALSSSKAQLVSEAIAYVSCKYPAAAKTVYVEHYHGGPCHPDDLRCCLVAGGSGRGWSVIDGSEAAEGGSSLGPVVGGEMLNTAVRLAASRAARRSDEQGPLGSGCPVRLHGLQARADLNGQLGITLRFMKSSHRWEVRLCDGSGLLLKPTNLEGLGSGGGTVMAFWGDAQWSRTQLLGELARGNWGMCRASVSELIAPVAERRPALEGRLLYSPVTEMTDDFIRTAAQQMQVEADRNARTQAPVEAAGDSAEIASELHEGSDAAAEMASGDGEEDATQP